MFSMRGASIAGGQGVRRSRAVPQVYPCPVPIDETQTFSLVQYDRGVRNPSHRRKELYGPRPRCPVCKSHASRTLVREVSAPCEPTVATIILVSQLPCVLSSLSDVFLVREVVLARRGAVSPYPCPRTTEGPGCTIHHLSRRYCFRQNLLFLPYRRSGLRRITSWQ